MHINRTLLREALAQASQAIQIETQEKLIGEYGTAPATEMTIDPAYASPRVAARQRLKDLGLLHPGATPAVDEVDVAAALDWEEKTGLRVGVSRVDEAEKKDSDLSDGIRRHDQAVLMSAVSSGKSMIPQNAIVRLLNGKGAKKMRSKYLRKRGKRK